MSISSELLTLNNTKTAIRTAINNKGGSVGANDTFASYATAIDNLPSGGDDSTLIDLIEGDITSITIPSGTTGIKAGAFQKCTSLTSVSIPNTVTSIDDRAFFSCSALQSINIPSNVTRLGVQTFGSCGFTTLTLPNSVTTIPSYMVDHCDALTKIIVGNNVSTIQSGAFSTSGDNFVLSAIVINTTTVPNLQSTDAFNYTHNCPIYVPAESLNAYKTGYRWSNLASIIYPITQVATVDGNPVYNYDIGNTDSTVISDNQRSKIPTGDSIEFAEGVTQIGGQLGAYEEVVLPSTFLSFDDTQPINAATTTLTSKATTPPSVERSNLGGSGLTAVYVPASAVDTYKSNAAWGTFSSIIQAIPSPTPSVTSITFAEYQEQSNPADFGDFAEYDGTEVLVDSFLAASDDSTFDSDIKAAGIVAVEDNNGNDITSQCTFTSSDFTLWDSTQDPDYDGESEPYYEWRLTTTVTSGDEQSPHSATITAAYESLSDTFTIEWTTTSNGEPE